MTILHEEGRDCQRDSKDGSLSVLTNARSTSHLMLSDKETANNFPELVLLAGIFDRLDKLVSIVEKIKIPRMLL